MVYTRELGDTTLTLIVSGMLWRNSLVMQDEETGTLWSHVTGEALAGKLVGRKLQVVPSVQTRWGSWLAAHPETRVLVKEEEIKRSRYQRYFADKGKAGIFPVRYLAGELGAKELVVGVAKGPYAAAVTWTRLAREGFAELELGGERVIVKLGSDGGALAFLSRWRGEELHLDRTQEGWRDNETGSQWDLDRGSCIKGKLVGAELERIPAHDAFWFAWSSFYPHTSLLK